MVEAGGGLLVADAALTPAWVRATSSRLLTDPARLPRWARPPRHLIPLDADEKLARMILDAAGPAR